MWAALDYTATKGVITGEGTGDPDKLLRVATEPEPPAAPTGLTAAVAPATGVGSGQVKLTWTAPAATPAALTDYVIERSSDGTTGWTVVDDGVSTATTATVGGLQNGSHLLVPGRGQNVRGRSGHGSGAGHTGVDARRPRLLVHDRVPSGRCRPVRRAAHVGQRVPNGSAVTDYLIEWSLDGATWTRVDDGVSTATTYTVKGLAAATSYTFRVAAVNGIGTGAWQLKQASTPATEPAAPNVTAAVAPAAGVGSGEVKLSWSAPASNGSAITDYQIQSSLDGTTWSTVNDPVSAATGHTLTNLTGGTAYQIRVAAKNAIGTGPWSASVTATPATAPAAPSGVTAAVAPATGVGSGQVKLSWTTAAGNGSAITDYLVERSIDGVTWTRVDDGVSTSTTSTVGGLINGTQYRFRVAASNAVGTGSWSATVTATPVGSPEAPSELTAQVAPATGVGSGEVKLSWTTPANNGSAVTDYLIERSLDGTTWTAVADGVSTSAGFTVGGLINGTQYRFRVAAVNGVGVGSWSATVSATPAGLPGAASGLTAAVAPAAGVGSGEVKLSWTAAANNGSAVTDYLIERSLDGTTWTAVADGVSTSAGFTVGGLTNGTPYSFRVSAVSAIGTGPWSAVVQATPAWTAAAPSGLTVAVAPTAGVGSGQVKLSWTAASNNGSAISDYLIEQSVDGTTWTAVVDGVSTSTGSTVGGLTNGTPLLVPGGGGQRCRSGPVERRDASDSRVDGGRSQRADGGGGPGDGGRLRSSETRLDRPGVEQRVGDHRLSD